MIQSQNVPKQSKNQTTVNQTDPHSYQAETHTDQTETSQSKPYIGTARNGAKESQNELRVLQATTAPTKTQPRATKTSTG